MIFLNEKKDGMVKARACAGGRKQWEITAEGEVALPTVSVESVFITCAMKVKENQDIAVIDLPVAFLQADCKDHVNMKFQERLAELMALAASQICQKYITTELKGKFILFVKLQEAMGC